MYLLIRGSAKVRNLVKRTGVLLGIISLTVRIPPSARLLCAAIFKMMHCK